MEGYEQEIENVLIVLKQVAAGKTRRQLLDHFLDLIVFQPGLDHLQLLT